MHPHRAGHYEPIDIPPSSVLTPNSLASGGKPSITAMDQPNISNPLITGTDNAGQIIFTVNAPGSAIGTQADVTFSNPFPVTPNAVVLFPASPPAAAASASVYVTGIGTNGFDVAAAASLPASATPYIYSYVVL